MRLNWSSEYDMHCVVAEAGDSAQKIIDRCKEIDVDAVRRVDGIEFCVQIDRPGRVVGPELWTEDALRDSLP